MSGDPTTPGTPGLTAYVLDRHMAMPLAPAGRDRDWMRRTPSRFAYHCLPLLLANQSGWLLLSGHTLRAHWTGHQDVRSLTVECLEGPPPLPAISHFGSGVLTWSVPYLFRTSPGWNLLVRGPANQLKDGIQALEGLVETDWSPATFTMNWKFTRPDHTITFEQGEPIAMLVPQRRGELETVTPALLPIGSEPELAAAFRQWSESRAEFQFENRIPDTAAFEQGWQQDYLRGEIADSPTVADHQTRRHLKPFPAPSSNPSVSNPSVSNPYSSGAQE